jgi:hypothetical protein
MSVGFQ